MKVCNSMAVWKLLGECKLWGECLFFLYFYRVTFYWVFQSYVQYIFHIAMKSEFSLSTWDLERLNQEVFLYSTTKLINEELKASQTPSSVLPTTLVAS